MANLNLELYFESTENKYYEAKFIITILEDLLNKPIKTIKKDIENNKIIVTKEQIKEYLEMLFIKENPELKKRIENSKFKKANKMADWIEEDIKNASQEFIDNIAAEKYHFEPYTLDYFTKYTTILQNKINLLLDIIEKIGTKDISTIQEILTDLDIVLDENGNILKSDIIRLITPTIYNIQAFNYKISKANNLSTYLTFKMSKNSLYHQGLSENEIYPAKSIQVKNLYLDCINGNVRLSEKQRKEIKEKEKSNDKRFSKKFLS